MTRSKCPQGSGSLIAGVPVELQDNLEQGRYGNYAQYLTGVLQALRDQDGIAFGSIEPLNEPDDASLFLGVSLAGIW
jgi:hypothetical protein